MEAALAEGPLSLSCGVVSNQRWNADENEKWMFKCVLYKVSSQHAKCWMSTVCAEESVIPLEKLDVEGNHDRDREAYCSGVNFQHRRWETAGRPERG